MHKMRHVGERSAAARTSMRVAELTEAENSILAQYYEPPIYDIDLGEYISPVLRPSFLRWFITSQCADQRFRGLVITGVRFHEAVTLDDITLTLNLDFVDCQFDSELSLRRSKLRSL